MSRSVGRARIARNRTGLGSLFVAVSLVGCQPADAPADASADTPAAITASDSASLYAARLMSALGGQAGWDGTRYLSFRWLVEREGTVVADREHSWDRYDGSYRLAFEQGDASHLHLFNVQELVDNPELGQVPTGRAWVDGTELQGAARDSALRRAYTVFINDTYWALMPFKWTDPGVHLTYEGMSTLSDGNEYATVHLGFDDGLGVTNDQYWGYVDPETGRMVAWQYHLGRAEAKADVIWWSDWERVGDIQFAMSRVQDGGERFMYFEDVVASDAVPSARFDPPSP